MKITQVQNKFIKLCYLAWIEQSDSRSSKKKEYNLKYKNKKKVKLEEIKIN